jgi:hypothetical protein
VFAAAEGMEIALVGNAPVQADGPSALQPAVRSRPGPVVMFSPDPARVDEVRGIVSGDEVEVHQETASDRLLDTLGRLRAGLLLIDGTIGYAGVHAVVEAMRATTDPRLAQLPCVVLGAAPREDGRDWSGVAGWLSPPYSPEYARSRLRAFMLRARCRWQAAPLPADEEGRLDALRSLRLLDTPREERFDQFTRMATAMFDIPFAFISLVDADRQWFKSCIGIDADETSREVSFCAHAIHHRELFVVPDTLLDDRFAENPVVADGPRVRFYAGYPLVLESGHCIGTLCLADQRPRELSVDQARLLRDLGALVLKEIEGRSVAA